MGNGGLPLRRPRHACWVHGILGSRKNMVPFAQRIVEVNAAHHSFQISLPCFMPAESFQMVGVQRLPLDTGGQPQWLLCVQFGGKRGIISSQTIQFFHRDRSFSCRHTAPRCILKDTLRNMMYGMQQSKGLLQGFPRWQVLVIDLRCHGESASLGNAKEPHNVMTSAKDVLALLSSLKLFPQVTMLQRGPAPMFLINQAAWTHVHI